MNTTDILMHVVGWRSKCADAQKMATQPMNERFPNKVSGQRRMQYTPLSALNMYIFRQALTFTI